MTELHRRILAAMLDRWPHTPDELAARLQVPVADVLAAIAELAAAGLIDRRVVH